MWEYVILEKCKTYVCGAVYTERTDMEKARTDALYYALKKKATPMISAGRSHISR